MPTRGSTSTGYNSAVSWLRANARVERMNIDTDVEELIEPGMSVQFMTVQRKDEAFVKSVAQASDGLCCVFSVGSGRLVFVAAEDRAADLRVLVDDLQRELRSC